MPRQPLTAASVRLIDIAQQLPRPLLCK